jgi:hypothetical protein
MAEPNEPKKETTRIPLAPQAPEGQGNSNTNSRDTVQLPLREQPPPVGFPTDAQTVPPPTIPDFGSPPFLQPQPSPTKSSNPSVMPAPDLPSSGPIKETVRIPLRTVQMKKTQPLIPMPDVAPQKPSVAVTPAEKNPMPLLWLLVGISAVILIIQIWTYFS